MHTKDFIEQVEQLPFVKKTYKHLKSIQIVDEDGDNIMYVRIDKYYGVDSRFIAFDRLTDYEQEQFMHLVWQYISTPVDERENLKRYRYTLPKPFLDRTLMRSMLTGRFYFSELLKEDANYQQYFTKKEVESFPEEVRKVISVFDQEVVDE